VRNLRILVRRKGPLLISRYVMVHIFTVKKDIFEYYLYGWCLCNTMAMTFFLLYIYRQSRNVSFH